MEKRNRLFYKGIVLLLLIFLLMVFVLIGRNVMIISSGVEGPQIALLEPERFSPAVQASRTACLYLYGESATDQLAKELMENVLSQMRVPFKSTRVDLFDGALLDEVDTLVMGVTDISVLRERLSIITDWTEAGGNLMLMYLPSLGGYLSSIQPMLGIKEIGQKFVQVDSFSFLLPLIPGGEGEILTLSQPYESSIPMLLADDCRVYVQSNDEYPVPLLWRRESGEGTIVVSNLGYMDKGCRGFYAAAYSLLGDGLAYPVINGAAFFLDGFPSPVPAGNLAYIQRDYGDITADQFITDIWWEQMEELAKKYGIRYTGSVIEQYDERVNGEVTRNGNVVRYQYFGNSIVREGGEIAYCGYSHMPMVSGDMQYPKSYSSFVPWENEEAMRAGLEELADFCRYLYPGRTINTYVPPANILTEQSRKFVTETLPQVKAIAGLYMGGEFTYTQEFEVAPDGIVELPRIEYGYDINDYDRYVSFFELIFHYVNTCGVQPVDAINSEHGWNALLKELDGYMGWLHNAVPDMRKLTATELAAAVQRYDALAVEQRMDEDMMILNLSGFADEAYLLVRLNGKTPGEVSGGELSQVMEGLYLLRADEANVKIALGRDAPEAVK